MKKKIIKIILISAIFIILFIFLNKLLAPKYKTHLIEGNMIQEFYKEDKNHEVIFIGDCEVYANFSPMVLYEKEGISSYIRGTSQQLIWQSYSILKETLKYEIPKVVVFNVNAMRYSQPVSEAYNRLTIDKMKWSKEKLEIISSSKTEDETLLSYIFPILRYHSRFDSLTKEDITYLFKEKNNTFNGFLVNQDVKPLTNLPTKKILPNYTFADNVYEYLDKILELCRKHNIELILIKAPSLYPFWYDEYENQIKMYAASNNVKYFNFIDRIDDIGLDYSYDTYDAGLHLNLNGATKLSKYFANILKNEFNLTDYRNNESVNKKYQDKLNAYYDKINKGE